MSYLRHTIELMMMTSTSRGGRLTVKLVSCHILALPHKCLGSQFHSLGRSLPSFWKPTISTSVAQRTLAPDCGPHVTPQPFFDAGAWW